MTDYPEVVPEEMTTANTSWIPEPHPIPVELTEDFHPEPFTPPVTVTERMSGVSVLDRMDEVMRTRLTEAGYL